MLTSARRGAWPWTTCAALLIALVALGLRAYAIGWGLPYVDHPDEPAVGNAALGMLRRGDWNPRFFDYPSLYFYALRLVFEGHWRYGLATGLYTDLAQLPQSTNLYLTTPGFFVWGRAFSALVGAASVVLLYAIGRRWWGAGVGLAAAAVLAALPYHMRHSQYITVDVASALMALLALGAALRLLDDQRWRTYALAGLAAGLAASTKYNAGAVALAVVAAHLAVWGRASLRQFLRLPWAALWSLIGFVAGTPYALLTFGGFMGGIIRQYTDYAIAGRGDLLGRWPLAGYLEFFWWDGLYPLPFLAAVLGLVAVLARRDRAGLVVVGFVLPYLLLFLSQRQHFFRNLMPAFPPLALLAGIGIVTAARWLVQRTKNQEPRTENRPGEGERGRGGEGETLRMEDGGWRMEDGTRSSVVSGRWSSSRFTVHVSRFTFHGSRIAIVLVAALVVAWPLVKAVELTRFEAITNSKVRAGTFVRERIPHGAPIEVMLHPVEWANRPFVTITENIARHDAAWYRGQGYRYLLVDLRRTDRSTYAALQATAESEEIFPGDRDGQPGPRMALLDLGTHPELLAIERHEATFGGRLRLLGYQRGAGDLRGAFSPLDGDGTVPHGQALLLNFYWQPLARLDADYAIFLHLVDAAGHKVAQRDTVIRATDYPTSRWQPGELALDLADLPMPADLPPGEYRLILGVYRMDTMERLPLPDAPDNALELMTVQVP
jgi:hypothetical protein